MIRICKKHAQCYRCAKMDFGDKCDVPNGYGIDFLLGKPGTWYSTGSRSIMCHVENEPCESALCEVRSELGMQTSDISLGTDTTLQIQIGRAVLSNQRAVFG